MMKTTALLIAFALFGMPASAQSTQQIDNLEAALLPGWQTDSGSHMAALQLSLAPGWKTYWRSPGEAGLPPLFNWSGSENIKSVRIHWPTPSVFHTNGMQSIGYHDGVVFPLEVTAVDPTKPVHLRAQVDLGICREVCLPASIDLSADLTGPGAPDRAINAALAAQPEAAANAGLASVHCAVDPIADGLRITATMDLPSIGSTETVAFEAGQPDVWVAEATTTRTGSQLVSFTDMVAPSGAPFALDRSKMVLTVITENRAVEIHGCPAP
jgi:DsbC/DsbD-like thiol-disulfide interchange protein